MKHFVAALMCVVVGCASSALPKTTRTLPEPVVSVELPPEPKPVEPRDRWTKPVSVCTTDEGEETPPGVLLSIPMARLAGELRVSYNEIRMIYEIDQRTWQKERTVYERNLELADQEIERANKRAERTWWERHSGQMGVAIGFIVGAALTTAIVSAVSKADDAGE